MLFIDTNNLFNSIQKKFGNNSRLNFQEFIKKVNDKYGRQDVIAYVLRIGGKTNKFIYFLQGLDIHVKSIPLKVSICDECGKETVVNNYWDTQIITDALIQSDDIIIASNSYGLLPLLKKSDVIISSPILSIEMREICKVFEIKKDCILQYVEQ